MRSFKSLIGIAVLLAALALSGCSKDNRVTEPDNPEQPSLPSAETMTMDVGFFQAAQVDSQSIKLGHLVESKLNSTAALKLNYLNAAVRVFFLNVVAYSAIASPVAAFATAIHSVPQYQQDGSWLWTYVYVDDRGSEYSIFLRGKRMDSYVAWSMEVSSDDPDMILDHFLWFDGQVDNDGRSGYWQFYEPDTTAAVAAMAFAGKDADTPGIRCVRIDWENNAANDRRLAILINKPDDPEEGSTIVFDEAPDMSSIDFHSASSGDTGEIVWYPDGSGSIEWPDYNDGDMSCWDQWQYDTVCQ